MASLLLTILAFIAFFAVGLPLLGAILQVAMPAILVLGGLLFIPLALGGLIGYYVRSRKERSDV